MKHHIIMDCDNTLGINGLPMDDGLTLLYLFGRENACDLVGICCNNGNSTADRVFECNSRLLEETGRQDIRLLHGSLPGEDRVNESARFIAETAAARPGEIDYLGTGSLSNLYGAYLIDPAVFDNLRSITLMGGLTEKLYIHGDLPLDELNFSVDPEASAAVLLYGKNISIISGNNCLPVSELPRYEFLGSLCADENPGGTYIAKVCGYRFDDKKEIYGADSSYFWDGVAAAYILRPDLFTDEAYSCQIALEDMKSGYLNPLSADADDPVVSTPDTLATVHNKRWPAPTLQVPEGPANVRPINIPKAKSRTTLQQEFYASWRNLAIE